jgi:hypothetical protein
LRALVNENKKEKILHLDQAWIWASPDPGSSSLDLPVLEALHLPVLPAAPRHAITGFGFPSRAATRSMPLGEGEEGASTRSIAGEGRDAIEEGSRCTAAVAAPCASTWPAHHWQGHRRCHPVCPSMAKRSLFGFGN